MRVLHIHRISGVGGSERHLLALIPAMREIDVDGQLLVLEAPGAERFLTAAEEAGIPVTRVPANIPLSGGLALRVAQAVRGLRPDVVHTHLMHADLYGQVVGRALGTPTVSTVHSTFYGYYRQPYLTLARGVGRLAGRTIAISEHVAQVLQRQRVVEASRLRVIHYGLDPASADVSPGRAKSARHSVSPGGVVALVASRLVPHKGHDVLLQAMVRARANVPGLQLVVAGDGPLRADLERLTAGVGLQDAVRFLGFVPDLTALMALVDFVVFPTQPAFGEGFGLVNLEAMLAARPVVATETASIPEIVLHEGTGLLVPPGDVDALAGALVRLGNDRTLRERLGAAGRIRAVTTFGLERMASETLDVYREVLSVS